jgi:hypothetical protein
VHTIKSEAVSTKEYIHYEIGFGGCGFSHITAKKTQGPPRGTTSILLKDGQLSLSSDQRFLLLICTTNNIARHFVQFVHSEIAGPRATLGLPRPARGRTIRAAVESRIDMDLLALASVRTPSPKEGVIGDHGCK